jgi:ribosome-associated protein YbcJ (S4-like RNA binding protein)
MRLERERYSGAGHVDVGLSARARVRKVSASGQAEAKATSIGEAVSINRKVDDRRRTTTVMHAAIRAPQSRSFSGYWQRGSANHRDDIFGDLFAAVA